MARQTIPTVSAHGAEIPVIGFGTGSLPEDCGEIIATALRTGWRHIDTAQKYGTERGVGEGIKAAGIPRAEIFLTTKVSHEYLEEATFEKTAEECLRTLQQDYVDLLLVHWPNKEFPIAGTMRALAKCKRRGLTRHIGLANFNLTLLDEAIAVCPEPLVTLQTEFHPYLAPSKVLDGVRHRGMALTGYCPLGRGALMTDPVMQEIAAAKGRTPAQIALRWAIQHDGVIPIPRTSNFQRITENFDVFSFSLGEGDMQKIARLKRPGSKIADPKGRAPQWDD